MCLWRVAGVNAVGVVVVVRRLWRTWCGASSSLEAPEARAMTAMVAHVLLQHGECAEALRLQEVLVAALEARGGGDDLELFQAQLQLATAHDERGDPRRAERLLRRLSAGAEAALGFEHPVTLNAAATHGAVLNRIGADGDAGRVVRRTLAAAATVYDDDAPFVHFLSTTLAHVLENEGADRDAVDIYRRIIRAQSRELGQECPAVLLLRTNLGAALAKIDGETRAAAVELNEALATLAATCGPDHPDTAYARSKLAWCDRHDWDPARLRANVDWCH